MATHKLADEGQTWNQQRQTHGRSIGNELKSVCDSTPRGRWRLTEGGNKAGDAPVLAPEAEHGRVVGARLHRLEALERRHGVPEEQPARRPASANQVSESARVSKSQKQKQSTGHPSGRPGEGGGSVRAGGIPAGTYSRIFDRSSPNISPDHRNAGRLRRSVSQPPPREEPRLLAARAAALLVDSRGAAVAEWERGRERRGGGEGSGCVGFGKTAAADPRRVGDLRGVGAWAAGSTVAVCRVLGRGGVGPSVRAGGLDPFHPSGHDRR